MLSNDVVYTLSVVSGQSSAHNQRLDIFMFQGVATAIASVNVVIMISGIASYAHCSKETLATHQNQRFVSNTCAQG